MVLAGLGRRSNDLVATPAQNGDGLRTDEPVPPMTTIFTISPRWSMTENAPQNAMVQ